MSARLRDVAAAAGVHVATASRALNPETRGLVSAKTAERVLAAAKELSYVPNQVALGLKTNRTSTIGVVISDLTNPIFPPMLRGVDDVVSELGYGSLIVNTDNDPRREELLVASLRSRQVDGLIVSTARQDDLVDTDLYRGQPVVFVLRSVRGQDFSTVAGDDATGVDMLVEHLVGLGHQHLGHVAGPLGTSAGTERRNAFVASVQRAGLPVDEDAIVTADQFQQADGAVALRTLLQRRPETTAVVAGNDLLALGCYDALEELGLRCPEDVSVVGFNDMPYLDRVSPPLTTIKVGHYDLGVQAGRLLMAAIREPESYQPILVRMPATLKVRSSTAPPRAG